MSNIILFASGSGSNVENIYNYFKDINDVHIAHVFCNTPKAFVIERCNKLNIPCTLFTRDEFYDSNQILDQIKALNPDLIVLAGFLWFIPKALTSLFEGKLINIHPSLLPKYGGKGMYGMRVHEAVVANKEEKSGITIHYVNEHYDEGQIILQKECSLIETDSPEDVAAKVHALEYKYFPETIAKLLNPKN